MKKSLIILAVVFVGCQEQEDKITADICRQYLPIEIWNVTFDK